MSLQDQGKGGILQIIKDQELLDPLRAFAGHLLTSESVDFIIEVSNYEDDVKRESFAFVAKHFPTTGIPDKYLASLVTQDMLYDFLSHFPPESSPS